jgi:hypothetical protein
MPSWVLTYELIIIARNRKMKTLKVLSLIFIAFVFIMGCSGNYGKFTPQAGNESKETQRELIDNWSDYDIRLINKSGQLTVVIFDPKNDGRKILVGSEWSTVKNQEMWTEIVKANTTSDGDFILPGYYAGYSGGTSRVNEIWGPDSQLYGLLIYEGDRVSLGSVKQVDENTVSLTWNPPPVRGGR